MKFCHVAITFLSVVGLFQGHAFSEDIKIMKKNVLYVFTEDATTDAFVKGSFETWENETFDVFDKVKDKDGVAVDLGAWIGTTSIWLSKNFHHVVSAEPDKVSLHFLDLNLSKSGCNNVTICRQPVSNVATNVIFGARAPVLNLSGSYVKDASDKSSDYLIRTIPFKKLVYDYVLKNVSLNDHPISFIKCDIEGGEEKILEDVLHFAYNNNAKVFMSFHYTWWNTKNISDYEYLFKHFKTDCLSSSVSEFVEKYPFGSVLFEPIRSGPLVKKNIPVVIVHRNRPQFVKDTVAQLERFTRDIIVIDNNSTNPELINFYNNEFKYTLIRNETDCGQNAYLQKSVQTLLGDCYFVAEPVSGNKKGGRGFRIQKMGDFGNIQLPSWIE